MRSQCDGLSGSFEKFVFCDFPQKHTDVKCSHITGFTQSRSSANFLGLASQIIWLFAPHLEN